MGLITLRMFSSCREEGDHGEEAECEEEEGEGGAGDSEGEGEERMDQDDDPYHVNGEGFGMNSPVSLSEHRKSSPKTLLESGHTVVDQKAVLEPLGWTIVHVEGEGDCGAAVGTLQWDYQYYCQKVVRSKDNKPTFWKWEDIRAHLEQQGEHGGPNE